VTLEVRFEFEAARELDDAALRCEGERAGLGLEFSTRWIEPCRWSSTGLRRPHARPTFLTTSSFDVLL
jgi:hypothetical protein